MGQPAGTTSAEMGASVQQMTQLLLAGVCHTGQRLHATSLCAARAVSVSPVSTALAGYFLTAVPELRGGWEGTVKTNFIFNCTTCGECVH